MRGQDVSEEDQVLRARKFFFRVWTLVGIILLFIAFAYVMNVLAIPIGILIWTIVIVFVLRTPVDRLESRGIHRGIGTAIAYVAMFIVLIAIGILLSLPAFGVGDQFRNLIESIPSYIQQITTWYNDLYGEYSHLFQDDTIRNWINETMGALASWASEMARTSADGIVMVGSVITGSLVVIGFALVVAFWILMELPALGREAKRIIGEKHAETTEMIYMTFSRVMGGYIRATLVQCALIGVVCAIAFSIIGVPNAIALGGITGILNIIPVVGPWLGGALAALVGVFVSPWIAIVALIVTIAVQQFIYTFVSPKLMANSIDVHPALVIIALMAGSAIGGAMSGFMGALVGMLASIPAVAALKTISVYYFEKRTGRKVTSKDGVFFKEVSIDKDIDRVVSADDDLPPESNNDASKKASDGKGTEIGENAED